MTSHHNARWAVAGAVGSVALAAGLSPAAFAETGDNGVPQETVRTTLAADVVLSLRAGQVALDLRRPEENTAPDADLVVGAEAATTVPTGQEHAFLGEPGSRVWILDGRRTGTPIPHWDTSDIPADELVDGSVDWALTGIDGPGDVKVFRTSQATAATETGSPAPEVLFDSTDGLPDTRSLPAAQNGEVTWAFTRPGEYRLTSRATAQLATGRTTVADAEWIVRVEDTVPPETTGPTPVPRPPTATSPEEPTGEPETARVLTAPVQAPAAASAADSIETRKVVIDDGHVDAIAGKMVDGKLRALFKDSRNPANIVWREPSSVVLHVDQDAKEKVPSGSVYSFLGKTGSDFWLIPQVQKSGVVWAGWNTEALNSGDLKGPIDMKLTKVSGPGSLAVWETAGLGGAQVLYNSADGLPDSQKVNLGVHAHGNWGFSKQGVYKVTFQLSGVLANGRPATDTRTYTFAVGDVDPNEVDPGGGSEDGASTGGAGSSGGSDDSSGSPASGTAESTSSAGGTAGSNGGGSASGGDKSGGSLAHTGGGPALPLAAGAGALVVAGGAAVVLGRRRRRTVPTGASL
ncbi:TIGR03773 family transporter-associated surface protein [Streptomyces sp. CB02460]|uniref:TIGR03773 family transporter-associated surface protein n=1 Tax=Streptomyces sp. CB02460 TaxID=1703941 RepID=UPI000940021B|nr:TIGR03773 family transporter-associated surface protein [Streptomyces sp. CB02460]OKJ73091.1 hypothetical protein AMK30_19310 [Streptomyces sp. CB02460]